MAIYAVNYDGLRKRDTYNELIDYLQFKQEKIIYPDRFAKRLRESPQISNLLDGEGLGKGDLEEQEKNRIKEVLKEVAIIQAGGTAQFSRADPANNRSNVNTGNAPDHDEQFQDIGEHASETIFENNRNRQNRNQNTAERNRENLRNVHTQTSLFPLMGAHTLLSPSPTIQPPEPQRPGSSTDPHPTRPRLDNNLIPPAPSMPPPEPPRGILEGHDVTARSRDYWNRTHNPMTDPDFKEKKKQYVIKLQNQKGKRNAVLQNKRDPAPTRDPSPPIETPSKIQERRNKAVSVFKNRDEPNIKPTNKDNVALSRIKTRQFQIDQYRDYYDSPMPPAY